ncbi:MAG: choice-of-anchor Q domain-containing protein, partial [Anaerolineae bacterium]
AFMRPEQMFPERWRDVLEQKQQNDDYIFNQKIYANDSGYFGGLMIMDVEPLTLTNNLIAANHADEGGSGVYVMDSTGYLLHNTIANNTGGGEEGVLVDGVTNGNCTLTFTNTIVSSHTVGITTTAGSTVTLDSALWYNNGTNIDGAGSITTKNDYEGDPDFVNPAGGNYHIGAGSAALDKGVGTWVSEDIDGDARPQGEAPDLGADERLAARPVGGASVPGRPLRVLLPWAGLAVFATFLLAGGTVAHVRR